MFKPNAMRTVLIYLARYAEIEQTLELEKETTQTGWRELVGTPGMATFIGHYFPAHLSRQECASAS